MEIVPPPHCRRRRRAKNHPVDTHCALHFRLALQPLLMALVAWVVVVVEAFLYY